MAKYFLALLSAVLLFATLPGDPGGALGPGTAIAHAPDPSAVSVVDSFDDLTPNEVIELYCVRCHSDRRMTGNLTLESFSADAAVEQPEVAEKVIRKLAAGMMPPPGSRRPDDETLLELRTYMEGLLDRHAAENPNPGRRSFQRLNRAEYRAAVMDLLGMEVDVDAFLPPETMSNNFDNIADVQQLSATLMEGYLRAASYVAYTALGDPDASPASVTYKIPRTASQLERAEGAPFGTRGGLSRLHTFPADGEYVFRMELHPSPTGFLFGRTSLGELLEVSIDGERAAVFEIDRWMTESDPNGMRLQTEPVHVTAGPHRVTAAFIKTFEGPVDDLLTPVDHTLADTQIGEGYGVTTLPHLRDLTVVGPYTVTGISENAIRRRILTCRPASPAEARPCAERILSGLGTRAYRRLLTGDDLRDLLAFYDQGAAGGDFDQGMRVALQALLASPHFIFRLEEVPADAAPGELYRISDQDLASRLSFFLWSAPPDRELIELADGGRLSDPGVLDAQVDRMLADPRAEALGTRFASQWLRLQDLEKLHPDAQLYPYYDATLAEDMKRETELFFYHMVEEDRSLLELLTADFTWVNDRLARHYGIPGVTGSHFRRVRYADDHRRGLLGHASILAMTSHANRTSPVLRGKWVMEVLLGSPPPPPPPGVPDLEETDGTVQGRLLTVRERMEEHRKNPQCTSCHKMMDPIGLALENYDVTGAWRIKDEGMPVDPVGELFDGSTIGSAHDLRAAFVRRPEGFIRTFTENLMAYALGRRVEYFDMPTVRAISRAAAGSDYRLTSFIKGVVHSPAFQMSVLASTELDGEGEGAH
ncbi:MAG TPA: DUF1592 domain-containing protein [Longimicrobiales bacterium]|nr:DUF1592 domain-containing protein [Longimicrobiales bacterium]